MATKNKRKKDLGSMALELDGKVFLVDRQPGKKTVKTEIDGKLVLQVVLRALMDGIALMDMKRTAHEGR